MDHNLPTSLALMFGHEGGYVNRKTDRGGPTKYGVTARTLGAHRRLGRPATAAEVKALTLDEATEIYKKSYWIQSGGSLLPDGLDYAAFDFGVNSGPSRAVKYLQRVVGAGQDGIIGAQTMEKVMGYPGGTEKLIRDYCNARMGFLRSLGGSTGFRSNGRGWTIRVTGKDPKGKWKDQPGVIGHALQMYRDAGGDKIEIAPPAPEVQVELEQSGANAKASEKDTGWLAILKNPLSVLPMVGGALGPVMAVFEGDGPVQYGIAVAIVLVAGTAVYFVAQKVRNDD